MPSLVLLAQDLSQSAVKVSAWSVVSAEGSTGGDSSSKLTHMAAGRSQKIQAHPFDHWRAYGSYWVLAIDSSCPFKPSIGLLTTLQHVSSETARREQERTQDGSYSLYLT